jgi:hypothetical protein
VPPPAPRGGGVAVHASCRLAPRLSPPHLLALHLSPQHPVPVASARVGALHLWLADASVSAASLAADADLAAEDTKGEGAVETRRTEEVGRVLAQKVHSTPITQQAEQSWLHTRREQMTCQSIFPEN